MKSCCQKNIGPLDRAARVLVGVILLLLSIYVFGDVYQVYGLILALIFIITGVSGFCLIYAILGYDSLIKGQSQKEEEEIEKLLDELFS